VWRHCKAAGVPFFYKGPGAVLKREINRGEYLPSPEYRAMERCREVGE
jgi:hypothetical protein